MKAAQLPKETFISGDGHEIIYRIADRDYTTADVRAEVRKAKSFKATATDLLATPTLEVTLDGTTTQIIATLTAAQTRAIGTKGFIDVQVTLPGAEPLTILQQELAGIGDVTK